MSWTDSMTVGHPIDAGTDPASSNRVLGALCYLLSPLVSIIVLIVDSLKNDRFLQFHAIQAIGFAVAVFVYSILASIVYTVGTTVTLGLAGCVLWVLFFLPAIPWLYYTYLASQDKYFEIPWLTAFMVRQGWLTKPYVTASASAGPIEPQPEQAAPAVDRDDAAGGDQ